MLYFAYKALGKLKRNVSKNSVNLIEPMSKKVNSENHLVFCIIQLKIKLKKNYYEN